MHHIASERLQELLDYWKDECTLLKEYSRHAGTLDAMAPQVLNSQDLESWIFDRNNVVYDLIKRNHIGKIESAAYHAYALLPYEFFTWNRHGRRAVHLPRELQRPFSVAPFKGVRFHDVRLPFKSFVITLEEPLRAEKRPGVWTNYDAIWVTQANHSRDIRCRLLHAPHASLENRRLPKNALRSLEIANRRGFKVMGEAFLRVNRRWLETIVDMPGDIIFDLHSTSVTDNDFVADHITPQHYERVFAINADDVDEVREWQADWICRAAKIVIGWCLYQKHLPSESYVWTAPRPRPVRGTRGAATGVITNTDHICTILRIGNMDIAQYREKNPDKEGSGFFQWPHVRSSHWKRERGAGPKAPKTVFIAEYSVRDDLMPLFGVHGGKVTNVVGDF